MAKERLTRKEQREQAREKAKQLMAEQAKKDKRTKRYLQFGILGTAVAIALIVVLVIANQKPPAPQQNPANMATDAVVLEGDAQVVSSDAIPVGGAPEILTPNPDKVNVAIYLDYLCPFCGQFEKTETEDLLKYMKNGDIVLQYFPVGMLGQYSITASNASACVASLEPDKWWKANNAIFSNQPEESVGQGMQEKSAIKYLKKSLKDVGLSQSTLDCVSDNRYRDWVIASSENALTKPLPNSNIPKLAHTPTVIVDGVELTDNWVQDSNALNNAIESAKAAKTK